MGALTIGGVPEHFNLPWRRAIESGSLRSIGIEALWQDFAGGTGAMATALNDAGVDVAMLLTEGAVAGIANGGSYRIVSVYTETPLIWGIHVPATSAHRKLEDLRGARYAISRFGSGSHLMAFAHASRVGWPLGELRFEVVGTLDGAVAAFEEGRADVFLWEKFMTKPLVDSGAFRRIGDFAAPWPAFVVCVSQEALLQKKADVAAALQRVFEAAAEFAASPDAPRTISEAYGLQRDDAAEWLRSTRWARRAVVRNADFDGVFDVLKSVGLVAPDRAGDVTAELPGSTA